MALRKIVLPLDTKYTKHFKIDNYGFFINSIPPGLEAYIILNNDPSQQIALAAQTKVPREMLIKEFTFTNVNPLPNRILNLYIAEAPTDFLDLPDAPTAGIEGSTIETNTILDQINNKINFIDTNNVVLQTDNIGLAKESTLSSMIQYIDQIEAKLDTLNSKDFATDTNLDTVNTKLDAINAKDFATETTLASLIQYIDQIEIKLDTLNSKDFATDTNLEYIKSKLDTLNLNDFATNTKIDELIAINQSILNTLTAPNIVFDTAEQFTNINTTQDFTITLTNDAVFDPNDYAKTATATDHNLVVYTCVYYNNLTKELTFNADPINGNKTATITVNYMKA